MLETILSLSSLTSLHRLLTISQTYLGPKLASVSNAHHLCLSKSYPFIEPLTREAVGEALGIWYYTSALNINP